MTNLSADRLVGRTVAHYEILRRLGGGGMGVVYKAHDQRLGRTVALKFLPQQWSHDEAARQRFIREAQAASATHHPNICTIHDIAAADDGQLFIVMGYYEGPTLKQRLASGPLPLDEALDVATQIADGLAKAHAQGIVHRDIKPGNIILTDDGVRIVDFGLATFADALQLTAEGSTLGTAAYMSPEQVRGAEVDARTDVWATGIVLYEMLTGHVPFRGSHAEAISYAIRTEPPPPIRAERPEVSEALEQLVFRALHKDAAIRFASGRELGRALREVRGMTLPQDLRTETVVRPPQPLIMRSPQRTRFSGRLIAAVVVLAALVAAPASMLLPIDREPVVVAPVINQTGDELLNPYRMALTQQLTAQLAASRVVRPLPYERLLQVVRRFRAPDQDVSSREALRALARETHARVLVVPTLLWDNGSWRIRIEYQDGETGTAIATEETPAVASSLPKDALHGLTADAAELMRRYFASAAPLRASLVEQASALVLPADDAREARMRSLDAAATFERGLDAYEQQEYSKALNAFAAAAAQDPTHPLPHAWRSRAATLMRQDAEATAGARDAVRLLADSMPEVDRLLVLAMASEARGAYEQAEARYRELTATYPDEPQWLVEYGGFLDRRLRTEDAIATYVRALAIDDRLPRPRLELCRMYNRLSDSPKGIEHAEAARARYEAVGNRGGEALARLCMADALRLGRTDQRAEARRHAETALTQLRALGASYNLARAQYYLGMIVGLQGDLPRAIAITEQALEGARQERNAVLEPLLLMNLGVANARMRRRGPALDYYRQSSRMFEALGDDLRAAQNYLNAGVLVIETGGNLDDGLRDVQNALGVVTKIGDKNFEVACRHALAAYYLHRARYADAERELNRAVALAREREMHEIIASLDIDLAITHLERGNLAPAMERLNEAVGDGNGPDSARARIYRAEVHRQQGNVGAARADLDAARAAMDAQGNTALRPLWHLARGRVLHAAGAHADARQAFQQAADLWSEEQPDAASVEGRAWVALLDAREGRRNAGATAFAESLDQARALGRVSLEGRIRDLQAQVF